MEVLKCFPSEWIAVHVCIGPEHQIFWDDVCVSICSDAARSPLVWFGVVSLTAGARIWIIFCLWYRWQPATHPETQRHILQLCANCCCLFSSTSPAIFMHTQGEALSLFLCVCCIFTSAQVTAVWYIFIFYLSSLILGCSLSLKE